MRGARTIRSVSEWVGILGVALSVAFFVKIFVLQAFFIPSESMEDTLRLDDRVLVNKLAYRTGDIERGDVIVFRSPPQVIEEEPDITHLIKRVIALPGDEVESVGNDVHVNGQRVDEPYLKPGSVSDDVPSGVIGSGQLWVMGDNRNNSRDSRYFGTVDEDLVVGRAVLQVWPLGDISTL